MKTRNYDMYKVASKPTANTTPEWTYYEIPASSYNRAIEIIRSALGEEVGTARYIVQVISKNGKPIDINEEETK